MQAFLVILTLAALALVAASPRRFRPTRSRSAVNTFIAVWGSVVVGILLGPTVTALIPAQPITYAKPLAVLGLGWIGVMVGAQARTSLLRLVSRRIWTIVALDTLITGMVIAPLAYLALSRWLAPGRPPSAVVALIAAAALGWAMETRSARVASTAEAHRLAIVIRASGGLLAIAAIIAVGVASIISTTVTPLATVVSGATVLVVAATAALLLKFAISITTGKRGDQLCVFLGAVGLAAGTAAEIHLSPLFAALLTGVAIANLPGKGLRSFEAFILRGEHVVAALFGLTAGILIDIRIGLGGLVLVFLLTAMRLLLKPVTLSLAIRFSDDAPGQRLPASSPLYLAPIRVSPVAIALGVSLVLLDPSATNNRVLAVLLISGLLAEVVSITLTAMGARRVGATKAVAA